MKTSIIFNKEVPLPRWEVEEPIGDMAKVYSFLQDYSTSPPYFSVGVIGEKL